jgi:Fic family protein
MGKNQKNLESLRQNFCMEQGGSLSCHFLKKRNPTAILLSNLSKIESIKQNIDSHRKRNPLIFLYLENTKKKKIPFKGHTKKELLNYRKAIDFINSLPLSTPLNWKLVKQIYSIITQNKSETEFQRRSDLHFIFPKRLQELARTPEIQDRFTFVSVPLIPKYIVQLHRDLNKRWKNQEFHPFLLIGAYILDFIRIHPMNDGNGRTVRVVLHFLLRKMGYDVGKYIDLEELIQKRKWDFSHAKNVSSIDYSRQEHNLNPLYHYLSSVILEAYRKLEKKVQKTEKNMALKKKKKKMP